MSREMLSREAERELAAEMTAAGMTRREISRAVTGCKIHGNRHLSWDTDGSVWCWACEDPGSMA